MHDAQWMMQVAPVLQMTEAPVKWAHLKKFLNAAILNFIFIILSFSRLHLLSISISLPTMLTTEVPVKWAYLKEFLNASI
jgi:hypothetical protein